MISRFWGKPLPPPAPPHKEIPTTKQLISAIDETIADLMSWKRNRDLKYLGSDSLSRAIHHLRSYRAIINLANEPLPGQEQK